MKFIKPITIDDCFPDENIIPMKIAESSQKQLMSFSNQYVGNKRKMVFEIWKAIYDLDINYDTILDLFSGSGFVGMFFKGIGKNVYSNDILSSSYLNSLAYIENSNIIISRKEIEYIALNNNKSSDCYISPKFISRFTGEEIEKLKNIRSNIVDLYGPVKDNILSYEQNYENRFKMALSFVSLINYILSRCFVGGRLNNGQILAKLDHRLSHKKNSGYSMKFFDIKISDPIISDSDHCFSYNEDALSFLEDRRIDGDIIYIDPPYGGDQSDYGSMYQFSEEFVWGMPIEDIPNYNGLKRFSKKKEYKDHFSELLSRLWDWPVWVFSYNSSSWANLEEIKNLIHAYKKDIFVKTIDYAYNQRKDRSCSEEYIIIAR